MFKSLREKLNIFKKKAREEIESDGPGKEEMKEEPSRPKSKFAKRSLEKQKGKQIGHDVGPKVGSGSESGMTLDGSIEMSGMKGDSLLKDGKPILEDKGGIFARKITEKKLEEVLFELEIALLESDVAQPVVERIKEYLQEELRGVKVDRKTQIEELIEGSLKNSISKVLRTQTFDFDDFVTKAEKPVVIMFVGVNGTGKTTAIARIAYRLKKMNISCVLAAGDTFRAGAIEQLTKHSEKLGLKLIKHRAGADPAAVAFDAIEHARARKKDVVLLDTAGRMQTNINLMDEMKKINRVAKPHLKVFVGDSLAGNDAVIQAQKFDEAVGVDGVILTKIDADAKGGAALSIAYTIGKPILFIGTGQDYKDLIPFDPKWMTDRLFEE
ncbi:MAG: signal recognition particle-docking protein FtsY [Candidatus Thermoplasmatota archaeon]|nr:signal recognition particle-docking protein FtsY [Candidatus Thermoplasmatota archaeon]